MKTLFLAGAALAVLAASPAAAQPGGEGRTRFGQPQTRAQVEARVEARFARADSNRDGFVTRDEVRARTEARRAERQGRRGERRAQRFERLDSNRDGMISRAVFDSVDSGREGRRAAQGDRRGARFAHRGGRGRHGLMAAGFGGRAFAMMDLDRDGRVALAEARRSALQRFDRADSNRDGTVTPGERRAARPGFREDRRED
jgi:Ca2+-binding EF-hand superfamily protein